MFLIMALVSGDDEYGLSSAWRSSGVMPYSSRKHTSCIWFVYEAKKGEKKKVVNPTFASLLSAFKQHHCIVFFHFSHKKRRKKIIVKKKKLETMCSTNYWLGAAIAIATMSIEFWSGPC